MATPRAITNYIEFWEDIVLPDFNDATNNPGDMRAAFHCAISLFHLSDWLFVAHGTALIGQFNLVSRRPGRPVDETDFANALNAADPNFELIRGIANSAKHLQLRYTGNQPNSPSVAGNTHPTITGVFSTAFSTAFNQSSYRVILAGPNGADTDFLDIAKAVVDMWRRLSAQHGWNLT